MPKVDSSLVTLGIASAVALAIAVFVQPHSGAPSVGSANTAAKGQAGAGWSTTEARADGARPQWAASATGRIEPREGEVRIAPQISGRIAEVAVKSGERVKKGDVLVRLDDEDHWHRHAAAEAEALVRKRERDEDQEGKVAVDRRRGEDNLSEAERALFKARHALDEAMQKLRAGNGVTAETVETLRAAIKPAEEKLASAKSSLAKLMASGQPLPTRLEAALAQARSDLGLAEQAIEKTRLRAPADGTILGVMARVGELAPASPDAVQVIFGDVAALRVRAEVEERDATKVRVGQRVVVRADAFPDREFEGKVTQVASALGAPRINTRGPRRPNDVEVLEVLADLDGTPPLLTGMRVDVFFRSETAVSAAPAAGAK